MSKESVVTASRVSPAVKPGRSRMAARKLTAAPCGMAPPWDRPVDPGV
jgi:hypothetical protein